MPEDFWGDNMKRFIDSFSSDILKMSKKELIESIRASEGRVIAAEVISLLQPLLLNISNAELAVAFGADLIILNMFDLNEPLVQGIKVEDNYDYIKEVKRLTGRPVGINLEPVDFSMNIESISKGRIASKENAKKAKEMGVDFIILTGNPKTGVTNNEISRSIEEIKSVVGENIILLAGKMHSSGIKKEQGSKLITKEDIYSFIEKGADGILIPAPGTIPGITLDYAKELIDYVHDLGAIAMTTIGTSQEGAEENTIKNIALMCKMAGADIHHIGDCGLPGIAIPENILAYSITIRGRRHTYFRIAASINR